MKTIFITGSHGEVGSIIFNYFKKHNYNVIRIIRNPPNKIVEDNLFFNYTSRNSSIKPLITTRCIIIHCGFDFNDKRFFRNSNFDFIRNLYCAFPNAYLINISSMSAFSTCKSEYGRIKFKIEKIVLFKKGLNLRLGIPIANPPISFHKLVLKFSSIFPFFNFSINTGKKSFIYTTDMIKFCHVIERFINKTVYHSATYSVVDPQYLTMKSFIRKYTGKPVLSLHWIFPYICLSALNFFKIKLRFGADSLISLVKSIEFPENNIAL
jgi:hypothetical protein